LSVARYLEFFYTRVSAGLIDIFYEMRYTIIILKITMFRQQKSSLCLIIFYMACGFAFGQDSKTYDFSLGRFSFSLSTMIMDDGSILDGGIGMVYTGSFSGELRARQTKTEKNEEFEGVDDSLNAVNQVIYEVFLLPFEYAPLLTPRIKLWFGIGGYYSDEALKEKGFFNMPELVALGKEQVNSYTNDFSLRVLGPVIDAGFSYRGSDWFKASLSVGIVPVFGTWAKQNVSIVPLLDPGKADYSQKHWGSPYLYADLSGIISIPDFRVLARKEGLSPSGWKLWFSLVYDYSRLRYEILDFIFDENTSDWSWYTPEREVVTQSFKIEGALLIPLGAMHLQIGGGRIFDSMTVDSGSLLRSGKNYLNISGKILKF